MSKIKIMIEKLPIFLLVCFIIGFIWLIMTSDYEDELNSNEMYCAMVKDGTWQDFNHNYEVLCKK